MGEGDEQAEGALQEKQGEMRGKGNAKKSYMGEKGGERAKPVQTYILLRTEEVRKEKGGRTQKGWGHQGGGRVL